MKNKKNSILEKIIPFVIFLVVGYCAFHFSSWEVVWNEKISFLEMLFINNSGLGEANDSFILLSDAFAIQINGGYYGVANTGRFLSSPVLSWILLAVAIVCFSLSIESLFGFDHDDSDD